MIPKGLFEFVFQIVIFIFEAKLLQLQAFCFEKSDKKISK